MEKSNRFSKQKQQRKKASKKRGQSGQVLTYRPIPTAMKVRIKTRTYETATNATSPLFSIGGLVEFLGYPGSYSDSLFGLYKYARIRASKITLRLVNAGTEPIILAVAPMPYDFATSTPTVAEILDHPKVVRTTVGPNTGVSNGKIVNAVTVASVLGKEFVSSRYEITQAQAASTTPIEASEPAWIMLVSAFNGLTQVSYRLEIEKEYDVEWYSLDSS